MLERQDETALAQEVRKQPLRDGAHLVDRIVDALDRSLQLPLHHRVCGDISRRSKPELNDAQPLLYAVVKVERDSAPLVVDRLRDPGA